jgi:hypothetical protein
MAGLLDRGYSPDPLAMGLLGMGGALLTPRQLGGGIGPAMNAFSQQAMQAQMLKRQMAQDAERQQYMRERSDMERQKFGFEKDQYAAQQADRQRQQERMQQVRGELALKPPDLLPLFDINPQAAMDRLFPKPGDAKVVAPGSRIVQDGKEVYAAPEKAPEPTQIERALVAAGIDPKSPQGQQYLRSYVTKTATHAPAANTTVYTGTMVPVERPDGTPGYVMPGKDGSVLPIPGLQPPGTARAKEASDVNQRSVLDRSKLMLDKIDSALGKVGFTTTAIPGAVLGKVPGSGAYDLRAEVETLKANFGFQELQQMRASSPTGGALGNVAVRELDMLQAAVQNLDPNQSPDQLKRNLTAARTHVQNWRNAVQMSGGKAPSGTQQRAPNGREVTGTIGGAAAPAKSIDDLIKQYGD